MHAYALQENEMAMYILSGLYTLGLYTQAVYMLCVRAHNFLVSITHLALWASWKQVVDAVHGGTQLG